MCAQCTAAAYLPPLPCPCHLGDYCAHTHPTPLKQISTEFVRNVEDAVSNGQEVRVRVINVDGERGKFAVTMIAEGDRPPPRGQRNQEQEYEYEGGERPQLKQQARAAKQQKPRSGGGGGRSAPPVSAGDVITGKVASAAPFGAFVEVRLRLPGGMHGVWGLGV